THGSIQHWISDLAKQADSRASFNELMNTHVDFSEFLMNRLKVDTLTPELLAGLTYELMKGSCKSLTKAADYGHIKWIEDLVPHIMWSQTPVSYDKHALWGISYWGHKRQQFYAFTVNRESARDVYSKRRIIAVTELQIVEWHDYKHMDWITPRWENDPGRLSAAPDLLIQSGNPTFSLHKEITSPEVTREIHDSKGCNFLSEKLPDIDSFNDIHPHFDDNPLSDSTTYSSNSLLEEFTDELALITYPPDYDDNLTCDIEFDLREIEFPLYQGKDSDLKDSIDQTDLANFDDYFVDPTPEMFIDEHAPDYSFPLRFDVYPDDFLETESDADNFYDDTFDSKGEKIKESQLLIDELDLPCDFLPYSEYDSFASQDFSGMMVFPHPIPRIRYLTQES
nr:hypothetical protein [Tanacetum cinerariifolium]